MTLSPKAQRHVGVLVEGFDSGWIEPDDGREAEFAGGGSHVYIEALEI